MAASAGTILMRSIKSGRSFSVDLYIPDATATYLTMNPNGLAASTSPSTYRVPEDVVVEDISIAAAPTAVGAVLIADSVATNGGTVRWANQLATLNNRPKLALGLKQGALVQFLQF